jgi:DNA-binding response OmpR family regulator
MGTQSVYEATGFRGFTRLARARTWLRQTPSYDVAVASSDRVLAEMIHHAAAARGYACIITGAPALGHISPFMSGRASIVVLDLDHLELHATEAVRRMTNPDTLVIVVGSDAAEHTQVQAIEAGAVDFVSKPLSVAVLVAKIERHITRSS